MSKMQNSAKKKQKDDNSAKVEEMSKESYEQYLDQRFVTSTYRKN